MPADGVVPVRYAEPLAPLVAARRENRPVDLAVTEIAEVVRTCRRHRSLSAAGRTPIWIRGAAWSPNGRSIAYIGRNYEKEMHIFYVWLRQEDEDRQGPQPPRHPDLAQSSSERSRTTAAAAVSQRHSSTRSRKGR